MPLVLALSAIVPALLSMWYFWARDPYPEPPRVVVSIAGAYAGLHVLRMGRRLAQSGPSLMMARLPTAPRTC